MKTFAAAALATLASASLIEDIDMEFMKYVAQFNKRYGTLEEFIFRNDLYRKADQEIEEFNAR